MIDTILFDLDGTLLPMDQEEFVKYYFTALSKKMAKFGFDDPKALSAAVYKGTAAMVSNDGDKLNRARFWETFSAVMGDWVLPLEPEFDSFYQNEFNAAREGTWQSEHAVSSVHKLKEKGYRLILATNPIFPRVATLNRISWAGLSPQDFSLITTYENSRRCKPNPDYFRDILEQAGAKPQACLMVGNDVCEDLCAQSVGISSCLITDCMLNADGREILCSWQGTFAQFEAEVVDRLPVITAQVK